MATEATIRISETNEVAAIERLRPIHLRVRSRVETGRASIVRPAR
jgi:hypothetical protein